MTKKTILLTPLEVYVRNGGLSVIKLAKRFAEERGASCSRQYMYEILRSRASLGVDHAKILAKITGLPLKSIPWHRNQVMHSKVNLPAKVEIEVEE